MSSKSTRVIITGLLIVLAVAVLKVPLSKPPNRSSLSMSKQQTQTFKCQGMEGFTFDFPIFPDWEVKNTEKTDDHTCIIWLNWPVGLNFEMPPGITVKRLDTAEFRPGDYEKNPQNPQGVFYKFVYDPSLYIKGHQPKPSDWDHLEFYGQNFSVRITPYGPGENYGFSLKEFMRQIIESFRFTE